MRKNSVSPKTGAMTSTLRCFQVLEILAEEPFELTASDISEMLLMPRASAYRLCTTLAEAGYIARSPASKRYRLTPKPLWVGSGYLRHSAIYRAAFFPMQALVKAIPAPTQLAVLHEGEVLFIYSLGSTESTEAFADVGLRRPLHATASGKLFLADMPRERVKQIMSRGVTKYTQHTTVSFAKMEKDLHRIQTKGYAVNDEELLPGFVTLAAPVYDASHHVVAAVSVTLSAEHAHAEKEAVYAAPLCEAARKTSLLLGHNQRFRTLSPAKNN
jgi:DNA-binding IclR family transcriptional regulator